MEIEIYTNTIFSRPLNTGGENEVNGLVRSPWKASLSSTRYSSRFKEVRPRSTNQERFIVDRFDGPESDGNPYPVQPSTCTLLSVSWGILKRNNQPAISAKSCSVYGNRVKR